jgi:hypothetical protein
MDIKTALTGHYKKSTKQEKLQCNKKTEMYFFTLHKNDTTLKFPD